MTQQDLADTAGMSRQTLIQIEKGSPDVAMGNYMKVLFAMGLHKQLTESITADVEGFKMVYSDLPQRVRS